MRAKTELNIDILIEYRLRSGFSQDSITKATGIDIKLLETGITSGIKLGQLNKLAHIYGCRFSDFYEDEILPPIKTHICHINEEIC